MNMPRKQPASTKIADTTDKMGKIIHRFNKKAARAVNEVFDHSFADRESDALLLEPLTDRFMRLKSYLKPYFGISIDDVVRNDQSEPRPYVLIHLIPLTARALQLQEIARRHRIEKRLPQIPFPLTVYFYFELPLDHPTDLSAKSRQFQGIPHQEEESDGGGGGGEVPVHGEFALRPDSETPALVEGGDAPGPDDQRASA